MGEWSEYFEDFPEENPANYTEGRFNPQEAKEQRQAHQKAMQKLRNDQQRLDTEIAAIVQQHKNKV
jgi:Na+-transporting methylmalonyl-CoA/oxaloacetate decarboxylase gamma subunit